MTIISGHCTKCGHPAGTCQCDGKPEFDEGELWSFLRNVTTDGLIVWRYHQNEPIEKLSARLDASAHERVKQLINLLNATRKP